MKSLLGAVLLSAVLVAATTVSASAGCPCLALTGDTQVLTPTADTQPAPMVADRTEVTLKIGGITCDSCAYIVNQVLEGVAGVQSVALQSTADSTVIIAVVDCDPRLASGEELAAATNGVGYPTEIIDDNPI
jgi:copper chaperone CopZ